MVFTFGKFTIDADIDKTRKFYEKSAELITSGCSCNGCANYEKAAESFPKSVKALFRKLGIDPRKAAEIYVNCSEENGEKLYYGGFYHICGQVLNGEDAWLSKSESVAAWKTDFAFEIEDGYRVSFGKGGDALLEDDFPRPVITMDIDFHVPWVLDVENTYN